MNKIVWTDAERRSVAIEAFKLRAVDPDLPLVRMLETAQTTALNKSRHRSFQNGSNSTAARQWLTPVWDEMRAQLDANSSAAAMPAIAPGAEKEMPPTGDEPADNAPANEPTDARPSSSEAAAPGWDFTKPPAKTTAQQVAEVRDDSRQAASANASVSEAHLSRVHWNDTERLHIAKRAYANLQRWPDIKKIEAFRKAQESEMPRERQRFIQGWSSIADWAQPLLDLIAVDEQIEQARIREETEARVAEEQAQREAADREAARVAALDNERKQNELIEAAVKERLAAMPVESLIRAFAARIAKETITAMGAEFQTALLGGIVNAASVFARREETTPAAEDNAKLVAVPKNRLPRLMVCGLMRQQEDDVQRAFLGAATFVFVKSQKTGGNGEGVKALKERCGDVDLIINMIDFAGHDMDRAAKETGVPFLRLSGQTSALKRTVREWLDGKTVLKAA